jgi:hypothetical protein
MMGALEGRSAVMFIRHAFITSLLAIFGYASVVCAQVNTCSNVSLGGYTAGLAENQFGVVARGTFRIEGEEDEDEQPEFNVTEVTCNKQPIGVECKVTSAYLFAGEGAPPSLDYPCLLDLKTEEFSMQELRNGDLKGEASTNLCFNTILTIDRDTKRAYKSFTKAINASGDCGMIPRTQVLMNCTRSPRNPEQFQRGVRHCDFSSPAPPTPPQPPRGYYR